MAQKSKSQQFRKLNFSVKLWAITHPFIVNKTFGISNKAKWTANKSDFVSKLDGQISGGQTDAFRHGFWMALLTREIGERRARSLGIAYENHNKADYRKGKKIGKKSLPDYISSKMDLLNNEIGIKIGLENKDLSEEKIIKLVIKYVLSGKMYIIKRNEEGNFLSKTGKIIPQEEYLGKWQTPKILVKSNNDEIINN